MTNYMNLVKMLANHNISYLQVANHNIDSYMFTWHPKFRLLVDSDVCPFIILWDQAERKWRWKEK